MGVWRLAFGVWRFAICGRRIEFCLRLCCPFQGGTEFSSLSQARSLWLRSFAPPEGGAKHETPNAKCSPPPQYLGSAWVNVPIDCIFDLVTGPSHD
jgi:hypothetical protein